MRENGSHSVSIAKRFSIKRVHIAFQRAFGAVFSLFRHRAHGVPVEMFWCDMPSFFAVYFALPSLLLQESRFLEYIVFSLCQQNGEKRSNVSEWYLGCRADDDKKMCQKERQPVFYLYVVCVVKSVASCKHGSYGL